MAAQAKRMMTMAAWAKRRSLEAWARRKRSNEAEQAIQRRRSPEVRRRRRRRRRRIPVSDPQGGGTQRL